ncbi:helix-turn-helix domain-containing protein [Spirosoma pollinicola]|uniref:HTH araC/xylS-type domain-containing protein n=1 Tax=Spirosoma pollinicola TaxID=2057025 RepID=A0A2K8Z2K5_9BACT|nr:helix-turn-helix domain-containing protein [Spirosoma pollinicola]AUD04081.1 hypothetical protein CWM47_20960 [Spirosoma pollinicola]
MNPPFEYHDFFTTPPLDQTIRKFWLLDNGANSQPVLNQHVLPNGCFNIACVKGQGALIRTRMGEMPMPAEYYFCGQATQSVDVLIRPFTQVLMIQLYPWSFSAFTNQPLTDTTDTVMPLSTILPQLASLLNKHQAQKAPGNHWPKAVMSVVESGWPSWLGTAPHPRLQQACQYLMQRKGGGSVQELAQLINCSTRLLEKLFKHYLGLSPKRFSTILRVRAVVDAIRSKPAHQPLAQVAADHGFYDEAHFSHTDLSG